MKRFTATILFLTVVFLTGFAQEYNQINEDGTFIPANQRNRNNSDSIKSQHKEIPRGMKVWTVDERFGDISVATPDTLSYLFMNTVFDTGMRGEYNTTGNIGMPRINRIFIDRSDNEQFMFTQPYDFFITPVEKFRFTNTLSPITNISYNTCGDRTNGEDHFKAIFAVNSGKRIGIGFKFDYIYGRGYYQNQSTSHFNYTMYGSYLGDKYQAHLLMSTNHQKVTENGGITDDNYITHPESFNESYTTEEIPTVLSRNWNRNDNQHIFFTHRYSLGFNRKVPMTEDEIKAKKFAIESQKEKKAAEEKEEAKRKAKKEGRSFNEDEYDKQKTLEGRPDNAKITGDEPEKKQNAKGERIKTDIDSVGNIIADENKDATNLWMKNEYVPVTSFIHTAKFDNYSRIYQAYITPENFYANQYYKVGRFSGDSIYDKTRHYSLKNTFAIALLEGFNKWAKAGLKAFVTSDLRHFELPDSIGGTIKYNEHNLSIGGQLSKTQGNTLHYDITAETCLTGEDAGQLKLKVNADVNFRLLKDTVQLAASGFLHRINPTFYYRHYHSKHFWWDNTELENILHSRIEGNLSLKRTRTKLRVAIDNIKNYTYFGHSYAIDRTNNNSRNSNSIWVRQHGGNINLITVSLKQDFRLGMLNWENVITYQKSSNTDVLQVPDINLYTNLFIRFKIAKVMNVDLGADARYFTKYYAMDYSPAIGQYTVQENTESKVKIGNYPIVNAYANFHLKHTRFFVMMSHINSGNGNYFLTPHYPINQRVLRFGISWNFFN